MLLSPVAPGARPSEPVDPWRVRVGDDDIREARDAWLRARHGGAPVERLHELREDLERLWTARAHQATEDAARIRVEPALPPARTAPAAGWPPRASSRGDAGG